MPSDKTAPPPNLQPEAGDATEAHVVQEGEVIPVVLNAIDDIPSPVREHIPAVVEKLWKRLPRGPHGVLGVIAPAKNGIGHNIMPAAAFAASVAKIVTPDPGDVPTPPTLQRAYTYAQAQLKLPQATDTLRVVVVGALEVWVFDAPRPSTELPS